MIVYSTTQYFSDPSLVEDPYEYCECMRSRGPVVQVRKPDRILEAANPPTRLISTS
jgi:hypothetical protein